MSKRVHDSQQFQDGGDGSEQHRLKKRKGLAGSLYVQGCPSTTHKEQSLSFEIFTLPWEVLELILSYLDAVSLSMLRLVCKAFQAWDSVSKLRLVDKVARDHVVKRCGEELSTRWRYSWVQRMQIEQVTTGIDKLRAERSGFTVSHHSMVTVHLEGAGPKLLVSDTSTADTPLLRWRVMLRGNNAMEIGVLPVALQDEDKSLHKCHTPVDSSDRPVGIASAITVGSYLPVKLPVMKGTVIEVVARKSKVEYIITNPKDGMEVTWHNNVTVPKPYK